MLAVTVGSADAPTASAVAPALSAPSTVYIGDESIPTAVSISYNVGGPAASVRVSVAGLVTSAACRRNGTEIPTELFAGAASATDVFAVGDVLSCELVLDYLAFAGSPVVVEAVEYDSFNVEARRSSTTMAVVDTDATLTVGVVRRNGETFNPNFPVSSGDVLEYDIEVVTTPGYPVAFVAPAGTTTTGCGGTAPVSCTVRHTVTVADLQDGVAAMTATALVDGFPVARQTNSMLRCSLSSGCNST